MMLLFLCLVAAFGPSSSPRPQTPAGGWQPLFDGKTLNNWHATKFSGEGGVKVENGQIVLETGRGLTGSTWAGPGVPTPNDELPLQGMRVEGGAFFAGVTFPVAASFCSLILGGWGGSVIGMSS